MQLIFSCSCQTWFYYSGCLHWYRSTYFLQGVDNLGYFKVVPIRPPPRGFVKQIPTNTLIICRISSNLLDKDTARVFFTLSFSYRQDASPRAAFPLVQQLSCSCPPRITGDYAPTQGQLRLLIRFHNHLV